MIGPKSDKWLNEIGIYSIDDLKGVGAIPAFIKLKQETNMKPSLNMLYAMVAKIEGRDWRDVAKQDKGQLLMAIEGYLELEVILKQDQSL